MTVGKCQNCNVSHGPDDMFCENCGYDFITGSLPVDGVQGGAAATATATAAGGSMPPSILNDDAARPAAPSSLPKPSQTGSGGVAPGEHPVGDAAGGTGPGAAPDGGPAAGVTGTADVTRLRLSIAVDRGYFDEVVSDGEIEFPDPVPGDQELELAGSELHIGRTSESRAIHPDVDVAKLTGDQAVSSRHAVLLVADDGSFTIVDVGSTNGTFLDAVDSEPIVHGVPTEVKPGVPIFVGAWTRLTILD